MENKPMTVGDLIEILKQFPIDLLIEIPVPHPENTGTDLLFVEREMFGFNKDKVCLRWRMKVYGYMENIHKKSVLTFIV